ncbi:MAG TPA: MBL fold metallo-hydrolase [Blastocatellia bacterium]|nr:MBL fold metallo-hydrolase [Blastocatellia bacterium]
MRLIILGSGSTGNVLYVESGGTRVLVDAGLSGKETARRMTGAGLDPARLDGIVITHEHSDHIRGLQVISKTAGAPVFVSAATRAECTFPRGGRGITWGDSITSGESFQIGSIDFHPFSIPHDGVDTHAFTFSAAGVKAGIVTDLGYISRLVSERLKGCDLVMLESNHDKEMLKTSPYPWTVKQRIGGRLGHISNDETARWIREDFDGRAQYLVLMHLSRHCNHPELARLAALRALDRHGSLFFPNAEGRLKIAPHDQPAEWFEF